MGAHGVICIAGIYEYKGYIFEFRTFCGPTVLGKNLKPRKRQPTGEDHPFWKAFSEWIRLSHDEKLQTLYRDGGCCPF